MAGECRQDDYLYPKLSAREHLELFAGIRGLAKEQVESDVQLWLESVDLDNVQENFSSTFSGGMKRRLVSSQFTRQITIPAASISIAYSFCIA